MILSADEFSDVSRETLERLTLYQDLLLKWNTKINLVAKSTLANAVQRHFQDSAQIFDLCPDRAVSWVDLGSGGGFPGLVVAILAAEQRPDVMVSLVESDQRKSAFLRSVIRETGVSATVITSRIEELEPQAADVISARALADLDTLLGYVALHGAPAVTGVFLKGRQWSSEVAKAKERWRFQVDIRQSKTEQEAVVLAFRNIEHV
ncbi:16S rRNA (guanine(527)-N(7))-methyltransferase RsmG [Pseudooceanicola sp. C21-150M6]|uniref:16S rRNA (guanine(527)-N(7))-methyltransferase RsmG n=1 Tax=Pseudooceanicola sp. C21-150M6 TaxID=3434355 RepID=UPI003D7F9C69